MAILPRARRRTGVAPTSKPVKTSTRLPARNRATAEAEAQRIGAEAEAARIRVVEGAKADGDEAHIAVYRDLPPGVLMGLAARDLAGKLTRIDRVNVTPDLLQSLLAELRPDAPQTPRTPQPAPPRPARTRNPAP